MTTRKHETIPVRNLYYMLTYVFSALQQEEYRNVGRESFDNIHNLFAAILARGIGLQLKQGLFREYRDRSGPIPVVRGRILVSETLRNRQRGNPALWCEYDELSENSLLNRVLKTAMQVLLTHPEVQERYKAELKKEWLLLSTVDTIQPADIRWSSIRVPHNSRSCHMLLTLCRFLLEGMLQTTEDGTWRLASFLNSRDLSWLYEKFILAFYQRECPRVRASAAQIRWALDDGFDAMLPEMRTDITLSQGSRILIIDAKCYTQNLQTHFNVQTIHSQNLYQIFAYVKNLGLAFGSRPHEVSGMLLYARTTDVIQPDANYRMSGNRICVRTLDLNREFEAISAQLKSIMEEFFPSSE